MRCGCGMAASNDTNQPQVFHTSTGKCTDRACLTRQVLADKCDFVGAAVRSMADAELDLFVMRCGLEAPPACA